MDELSKIRRRLFELVAWFGVDVNRLTAAQTRWRTEQQGSDPGRTWRSRVDDEVERCLTRLASSSLSATFSALSSATPADQALLELEVLDRAAWLWAGSSRQAPPEIFGEGANERFVVRLGRERRPHTARQASVLYTHLRHHALLPTQVVIPARAASIRVRLKTVTSGFEPAVACGAVSIATTSFDDDARIEWQGERAITIRDEAQRAQKLWMTIQEAVHNEIDLFVAPELTVTPAARNALARQLRWPAEPPSTGSSERRIALIVPGSFHEQVGTQFVHRVVILDGTGNTLFEHHKLAPFGVLDDFVEDIQLGDSLTVLVTPIGTIAVAICKDFCDDHLGALWHHVQPEFLLVPAYGAGASAHKKAAARVHRMVGTVTALAHQRGSANMPFSSFIQGAEEPADTHGCAPSFGSVKILF